MRTRSPRCSGCGPVSSSSLRYVPFVEPRSSSTMAPPWRSSRAWREEANGSSRRISAWSPRPMTAPSPTSYSMPAVWPGARSTTRRGSTPPLAPPAGGAWIPPAARGAPRPRPPPGGPRAVRRRRSPWRPAARPAPGPPRRAAARSCGAGPAARCARPRAGTGKGRPGTRTAARRTRARAGRPASPLDLEAHVDRADHDLVARPERRGADRSAVDLHAVRRAQVRDRPAVAPGRADLGVPAGDVGVGQHDVAVAAAPDHRAARPDRHALALGDDDRPAAARRARLVELLLHAPGGRVHHRLAVVALLGLVALRLG